MSKCNGNKYTVNYSMADIVRYQNKKTTFILLRIHKPELLLKIRSELVRNDNFIL